MRANQSKLKKIDFKGWKYAEIIGLPLNQKVLSIYPHFKRYPELDSKNIKFKRLSFDKVLRYIMIYYSNNILRFTIPEVIRRKKEAAFLAGFVYGKENKFGPDVEDMLFCRNSEINKMIVRFIRRSENKKFMQLCVFEEARAKQMQKLIDGIGEKEKELTKVVIDNVKTLSEDIETLENDILNEDKNEELIEMLYDEVDYNNLGLSPEEIAELNHEGSTDQVLKDPYRSKYDGSKQRKKIHGK